MAVFKKEYEIKWSDIDPNKHVRHSVYGDYATDVRMSFFAQHGYTFQEFEKLGFGPILLSEETEYYREVHLGDSLIIDFYLSGLSEDETRFRITHHVYKKGDEKPCTKITLQGGWLNLKQRKLTRPPEELMTIVKSVERIDYQVLLSRSQMAAKK